MNHNAVADAAQEIRRWLLLLLLATAAAAAAATGGCGRVDVTLKHRKVLGKACRMSFSQRASATIFDSLRR